MGALGRLPAAVALLAALATAPGAAAAGSSFGTPTATATYGTGIDFRQPVTLAAPMLRAELLLEFPKEPGPEVRVVAAPAGGSSTLRFTLETSTGGLLPNTTVTARWRLVAPDGGSSVGPSVTVRYDDTRFTWHTRQGSLVRVHWYQGTAAFGDRALQIGEDAIARTSRLLGVTETQPIDFFIYADQQAFYDALGPGTRENVGGEAIAGIRTLFALITPADINASWVGIVIPHELTHLVFDTAVRNPYHFPPRWLNEGLAVYLAQGYGGSDTTTVRSAVSAGTLMPLASLTGQFPTTRDRFGLAYAESVAAVDFLVRQKGEAALVGLIRSYANGVTDDEAFTAALGLDVAAFDAAWRSSLGARDPVAYGPVPAPSGPLPGDWTGSSSAAGSTGGATSSAGAVGTAAPTSSATSATPGQVPPQGAGSPAVPLLLAGLLLVAAVLLVRSRSRRRRDVGPTPPPRAAR